MEAALDAGYFALHKMVSRLFFQNSKYSKSFRMAVRAGGNYLPPAINKLRNFARKNG
jgi:hypothetical protein